VTTDPVRRAYAGAASGWAEAARFAGLDAITITETRVEVDLGGPEKIVRYRLGMPQYAAWLSALDASARRRMVAEAIVEVDTPDGVFRPVVLELVARAS
jgi:hypothetical protein